MILPITDSTNLDFSALSAEGELEIIEMVTVPALAAEVHAVVSKALGTEDFEVHFSNTLAAEVGGHGVHVIDGGDNDDDTIIVYRRLS